MSTNYPNGGWDYGGGTPNHPFADDAHDANIVYPFTDPYTDMYTANVCNASDDGNKSYPLSHNSALSVIEYYPHNNVPIGDTNRVHVGDTYTYQYCRGNMGSSSTGTQTVTSYLSADRVWNSADFVIGTVTDSLAGWGYGCRILSAVVLPGTPTGTRYILIGQGTSGNNIGVIERPLVVLP